MKRVLIVFLAAVVVSMVALPAGAIDAFAGFVGDRGPALKHALMAALGPRWGWRLRPRLWPSDGSTGIE